MLEKQLLHAGLSETEVKIYLAVLELGQTSISRIAQQAGIKRTTVYLSLTRLMEQGLISAVKKGNRTSYFAEDPRELERIMERRKKEVSDIIPQLLTFTNLVDKKPEIRYFAGEEGIKEVLMKTLSYPEQEILTMFSDSSYLPDFEEKFFVNVYRPERIGRKIYSRVLMTENTRMRAFSQKNTEQFRNSKFLPANLFTIGIEMVLYGNNGVAITSYKERFAFIIESPVIHASFKAIFETLWAVAKQ